MIFLQVADRSKRFQETSKITMSSRYDGSQAAHSSQLAEGRSSRKRRISDDDHNASAVPRKTGKNFAML